MKCNPGHSSFSIIFRRSTSAGKLINFLVEDGGHIFQGKEFAEIEVNFIRFATVTQELGRWDRGQERQSTLAQICLKFEIF